MSFVVIHLTISLVAIHVRTFVRLFFLYRLANVPIINLLIQKIEPGRESRVLTNQRSQIFLSLCQRASAGSLPV